jgi:hypothetical protein
MAASSETINQRFAQLIQQLGLNKNAFALSLGKTASVIQHLIDGRNKPGYDLLYKVFEVYPNVSRDWVLLGRGPMFLDSEPAPRPTPPTPVAAPELPLGNPEGEGDDPLYYQSRRETLAVIAAGLGKEGGKPAGQKPAVMPGPELGSAVAAAAASAAASAATPASLPFSSPVSTPAMPPAATPVFAGVSEASLALALQTQQLQHQLALAEMRNQHLLEQQQMLRQMLEMAQRTA